MHRECRAARIDELVGQSDARGRMRHTTRTSQTESVGAAVDSRKRVLTAHLVRIPGMGRGCR